MSGNQKKQDPTHQPVLPISPPPRRDERPDAGDGPDLHIEEIEDRHVPKDRNIFDK